MEYKEVESYNWIDGARLIVDVMTKEKTSTSTQGNKFTELIRDNMFKEGKESNNQVLWQNEEIVLLNPKEKDDDNKKEMDKN